MPGFASSLIREKNGSSQVLEVMAKKGIDEVPGHGPTNFHILSSSPLLAPWPGAEEAEPGKLGNTKKNGRSGIGGSWGKSNTPCFGKCWHVRKRTLRKDCEFSVEWEVRTTHWF